MTALNIFRSAEAVDIFTDTAIYDVAKNGSVGGFGSKVFPLPRQNAVLSCTGQNWLPPLFAQAIAFDGVDTFDGLVTKFSKLIRDALFRDARLANSIQPGNFEMIIAGVSEATGEAMAYLMRNYDHGPTKAFQVYAVDSMLWPELPHEEYSAATGLRALQRQREEPCVAQGVDKPFHIVGGDAVHARVSKAGVSFKRIWRWGDPVGQPIRPKLNPVIG